MTESLFEKPSSDWTGDEIRVGLGVIAEERDTAVRAGQHDRAEYLNDLLRVLAEERDQRQALFRAVDDAILGL